MIGSVGRLHTKYLMAQGMCETFSPALSRVTLLKAMTGEIFRYLVFIEQDKKENKLRTIYTTQTHRRVLGLICIGECSNSQEVSELYRIHESLRGKYSSTLYDSRCFFLGLQKDGQLIILMLFSNATVSYISYLEISS